MTVGQVSALGPDTAKVRFVICRMHSSACLHTCFAPTYVACCMLSSSRHDGCDALLQANVAAKKVFELLDAPGEEDWAHEDCSAVPTEFKGDVAFKEIVFEYPTRPGSMLR